jgi:hypothetical protein
MPGAVRDLKYRVPLKSMLWRYGGAPRAKMPAHA